MQDLKIGVLRIEDVDEASGRIMLMVAEHADCSGLPALGETVCNYDEGFIVEAVHSVIHEEDIFARVGGDEFCLILRGCPPELAVDKMTRAQLAFNRDRSHLYEKGFSFGIVSLPCSHAVLSLDSILKRADTAMYKQKKLHKRLHCE